MDNSLDQRLQEIELRLRRLEQHLEMAATPTARPAPEATREAPVTAEEMATSPLSSLIAARAQQATAKVLAEPALDDVLAEHAAMEATPPPPPPAAKAVSPLSYEPMPAANPTAAMPHHALEQVIGLKWAGWVGAIVLVIGAGMGVKFAYDNGYFGRMPPVFRLIPMALIAMSLIGAGEWVYRRINKLSATGLFGAGVALLFITSYAGYGYYQLYSAQTTYTFMTLSTVIGAAVAMRGRLVSIAVLSLIGGNLAPVLVGGDASQLGGFLAYLLMLQVVALLLAWRGGSARWWTLRGLALASQGVWLFATFTRADCIGMGTPLWFVLLYAGLYQGELILSALRPSKVYRDDEQSPVQAGGIVFSILVTAAMVVAILFLFRDASEGIRTGWVLEIAAAAGLAAGMIWRFGGGPLKASERYESYTIQCASLIAVAVPVALSGVWIMLGWGILAIAFAAVGCATGFKVGRIASLATWVLALADLLYWLIPLQKPANCVLTSLTLHGTYIPTYALLAWSLAFMGQVVAYLAQAQMGRSPSMDNATFVKFSNLISWWASGLWAIATIAALPPLGATTVCIGYAWLLALVDFIPAPLGWAIQAVAILALVTIKWVTVDTLVHRLSTRYWWPWEARPVFNAMMGVGVLLAGSIAGIYRLRTQSIEQLAKGRHDRITVRLWIVSIITALMTLGLSLEIDRVVELSAAGSVRLTWPAMQMKLMEWTILWAGAACVVGFCTAQMERRPQRRRIWIGAVWGILALLVCKFLILDTLTMRLMYGPGMLAGAFNLQMFTAVALAAALASMHWIAPADPVSADMSSPLSGHVGLAVLLILLWAGSMEIDRLVERWAHLVQPWPIWQAKNLDWTILWSLGAAVYVLIRPIVSRSTPEQREVWLKEVWPIAALAAAKYLLMDSLPWYFQDGIVRVTPVANVQGLAAGAVLAGLALHFCTFAGLSGGGEVPEQRFLQLAR